MICKSCNQENENEAKFCKNCLSMPNIAHARM